MLSLLPGYYLRKPNSKGNLFFADDLKTFAKNKSEVTLQLDLTTRFTNGTSIKFGLEKYTYIYIEPGKRKSIGTKQSATLT